MELGLKGRIAVVTGGGKGIGAGISKALASEGVKVLLTCNSNPQMAEGTADQIRQEGGEAEVFCGDVGSREKVDEMMEMAVDRFGGIDILVNNAAWQPNLDIDEYSEEYYDQIMNTNLGGYFRCIQASIPYLKKSKCPRIINISSVHGKRPSDFDVGYSMTKGGIKMLVREAAIELGEFGITVNAILPGGIKIEFKSGYTAPMKRKRIERPRKYQYYRGAGMPKDVADLVLYLVSQNGGHITGASIRLDGGAMLY
ncbi:MAG TPA: SDR family oxidoreductase [Clostridia bacterium]|nr:SDR family oxidoreductase [Clostridia bacterium]